MIELLCCSFSDTSSCEEIAGANFGAGKETCKLLCLDAVMAPKGALEDSRVASTSQ
jgi:hypothetical protein